MHSVNGKWEIVLFVNDNSNNDNNNNIIDKEEKWMERIERILRHGKHVSRFDTTFAEGLKKQFEYNGSLSKKQKQAIRNILERWHFW